MTGEVVQTPAAGDKPVPAKRKGVLYHEEYYPEGNPYKSVSKDSKDSKAYPEAKGYPDSKGYPKAKSDDYKRKSSSDDYKRRQYEEEQKNQENQEIRESCSTRSLLICLGASAVLLIGLAIALHVLSKNDVDIQTIMWTSAANKTQIRRKGIAIASDNLDCSILMKRYRMYNGRTRAILMAGLMCLYIYEPHSVAPDSGFSLQFYFRQSRASMAHSYEQNFLKSSCKPETTESAQCDLRGFRSYHAGLASIEDKRIVDTDFFAKIAITGADFYKNHYQRIFMLFYHMRDYGSESYPQVQQLNNSRSNRTKMGGVAIKRRVQISPLFESAFNLRKGDDKLFSAEYLQRLGINTTSFIKAKAKIELNADLVRHTLDSFLYTNSTKREAYFDKVLPTLSIEEKSIRLVAEKTLSPITSLIIYLVHSDKQQIHRQKNYVDMEAHFYASFMMAQCIAYEEFVKTPAFRQGQFSDLFLEKMKHKMTQMKSSPLADIKVQRKATSRVASILLWTHGIMSSLAMMNAGLPTLFGSNYIKNGSRVPYDHFMMNGKITEPVSSAAGVILFERGSFLQDEPVLAITASGSVRTVDAVATTVLRTMIFNEPIGVAANASSIFYDPSNSKFYCDKRFQENQDLRGKIASILKRTTLDLCDPVVKDNFVHNDRIVMAISKSSQTNGYMETVVNDMKKSLNYPVGY